MTAFAELVLDSLKPLSGSSGGGGVSISPGRDGSLSLIVRVDSCGDNGVSTQQCGKMREV